MSLRMLQACMLVALASVLGIVLANKHDNNHETSTADAITTSTPSSPQDDPVTVSSLGAFRGSWMETRRGRRFQAYRGIRYAEPPTGELRFQPPKPILAYDEEVNATQDGPACPFAERPGYPVDEDCLTINVYTPDNNRTDLPVIVFLHPGAFFAMSARGDMAGPHYLLDRDVVLVTINYRLLLFGFLSMGDEHAPGNNGFRDQVAALRWVQRNIAAFGGDRDLVTLAGSSAGAVSVEVHMVSPMSKGLFHRAIAMSGAVPQANDLRHVAVAQAKLLKCSTNSSKEMIDCFKTKPLEDLMKTAKEFYKFGFSPIGFFPPVVEKDFGQERFLPVEPVDAFRKGKFHSVPLIISQTEEELFWTIFTVTRNKILRDTMNSDWELIAPIAFLLPQENSAPKVNQLRRFYLGNRTISDEKNTEQDLGRFYADAIVGFPVHRMANLVSRHSIHPVYYYQFTYTGNHSFYEDPETKRPIAAAHQDDLMYLFTLSFRFPTIPTTSPDSHMVDKMTAIWYNFARYGDPHPGKDDDQPELLDLSWPAMKSNDRKYLRIADTFSVHQNLYEDRLRIWEELYPIEY